MALHLVAETARPPSRARTVANEVDVWDTVLRRYGETMDAQRAFLVSLLDEHLPTDEYELPEAFELPLDMPAMPAEARGVALALQAETGELIHSAKDLLARSARHLSNNVRSTTRSSPSAMDRRL
jgi:hypothetical protein